MSHSTQSLREGDAVEGAVGEGEGFPCRKDRGACRIFKRIKKWFRYIPHMVFKAHSGSFCSSFKGT